jgi:spore germination protein GerM
MAPEMKKNLKILILVITGILMTGVIVYLYLQKDNRMQIAKLSPMNPADPNRYPGVLDNKNQTDIYLYFANTDNNFLTAEKRNILHPGDPAGFGKIVVQELIKGPHGKLHGTIPEQTSLRAFYLAGDGIAYVDFSQEIQEQQPGGSHSEYLTIYSIVNSIVYNLPDIKAVKILINGNETTTLAGHIGIGSPIRADMVMVR